MAAVLLYWNRNEGTENFRSRPGRAGYRANFAYLACRRFYHQKLECCQWYQCELACSPSRRPRTRSSRIGPADLEELFRRQRAGPFEGRDYRGGPWNRAPKGCRRAYTDGWPAVVIASLGFDLRTRRVWHGPVSRTSQIAPSCFPLLLARLALVSESLIVAHPPPIPRSLPHSRVGRAWAQFSPRFVDS